MKPMRTVILFGSAFLLGGCLSPVKTPTTSTYVLNMVPTEHYHSPAHRMTLLVGIPETRPVINTTQMAYTIKPFQVAYYAQNQWAETPSQMLLPLIVQALQNTHAYHAVVTPPFAGNYQYALTTHVLQLQQNYIHHPAMSEVVVRAEVTNLATNSIVATTQISERVPIKTGSPYGGVISTNIATERMLEQLTVFCLRNTGR